MNTKWLQYRARDGVLDTHLDYESGLPAFSKFIRRTIDVCRELQEPKERSFCFLDSFFSDSISPDLFEEILANAIELNAPIQILVADPLGLYAKSRARSITQEVEQESLRGLRLIAVAILRSLKASPPSNLDQLSIVDIIRCINEQGKLVDLELRFYDEAPSGPMYFFNDLLLCGRFNAGTSAAILPWALIVNDSNHSNDLYDVQKAEFNHIWNLSKARGVSKKRNPVFISCSKKDEKFINNLTADIEKEGIKTFVFFDDIPAGTPWPDEVRSNLQSSSCLVAVLSENALNNPDWIRAEVGAAWVLGKHIIQANVSNSPKILPGIMAKKWEVDIVSIEGRKELIRTLKQIQT